MAIAPLEGKDVSELSPAEANEVVQYLLLCLPNTALDEDIGSDRLPWNANTRRTSDFQNTLDASGRSLSRLRLRKRGVVPSSSNHIEVLRADCITCL